MGSSVSGMCQGRWGWDSAHSFLLVIICLFRATNHRPRNGDLEPDLATFFSNIPGQGVPSGERTDRSIPMLGQFLASVASKVHGRPPSVGSNTSRNFHRHLGSISQRLYMHEESFVFCFLLTPCCHCSEGTSTNEMNKHKSNT